MKLCAFLFRYLYQMHKIEWEKYQFNCLYSILLLYVEDVVIVENLYINY